MKLIKLTPSSAREKDLMPVISPAWITGMEVKETEGQHVETIVYTARQGLYHRVRETPEQIMALINSSPDESAPEFGHLVNFMRWLNGKNILGQSHSNVVDKYLGERRRGETA